eukprot:CAMPEP_0174873782 /NCGR_PEP_ID=MMETSP1114-20130205/75503_1 /TAXON_ID=312471 /ORGANISM="Neobodo designis, Strain CCAP 1951/1" /LENGTH=257 /DNA_ID=CAMNT_0016109107 /DNA_START=25 /DNA_END=798 /DNA_ORIENTATION=+
MPTCADCGLERDAFKYCPETGDKHDAATACPDCGLTTPFCAVTGAKHGALPAGLRRRTGGDRAPARPAAAAAQKASASADATDEMLAYATATAAARRTRAAMTDEERAALDAFSDEGFGIFAPGNPALTKLRAGRGARGGSTDAAAADRTDVAGRSPTAPGQRLDIPEQAVTDMLATLAKSGNARDREILRDFQRAQQPRWMRKLAPVVRVIGIVMIVLVGLALLQGFVVHTFGPYTRGPRQASGPTGAGSAAAASL